MESKAEIENFHVEPAALEAITNAYGFSLVSHKLLTGGFSSSNYRCVMRDSHLTEHELMLKVNNPDHSIEDIQFQVDLLTQLQKLEFRTNYLYPLKTTGEYLYLSLIHISEPTRPY
eukprot:TRINITY_DN5431_c0_g1_i2.p1 TRINITY_DN5431_c0_g1~~TRINITY_DN5431_c0_g1_i2.p1  ORF type:complete len:116 (-),score=35.09 TRINITY_DN5431_c0_g1_i2:48-395(-)